MRICSLGLGALGILLFHSQIHVLAAGVNGNSTKYTDIDTDAAATETSTTSTTSNGEGGGKKFLEQVQDHYMDYPYPLRDPEDETKRLTRSPGNYLGEISHWLFEGKEGFKKGFRVLIAGGGTGDSTIFLAEQLKSRDAEIVYLDFSKNSMLVAQKRAQVRKLENIVWIVDSIMNIPDLGIGKFDYIQCSGVLHHLESPDAGFKILADSLSEKGGMQIMIYGQHGRTPVYHIQEVMRMVNEGVPSRQEEIKNGWEVINLLPPTNWWNRGNMIGDHEKYGDVGMYDLFLHKQDRAYTIPESYEFVEKAGLNLVEFIYPHVRAKLHIDKFFNNNTELLNRLEKMDKVSQQAICELMSGTHNKQSFYVSKKKNTVARLTDLDNVPYLYTSKDCAKRISGALTKNQKAIGRKVKFSLHEGQSVFIPISEYTMYLFRNMIDGTKSLKEIFEAVKKDMGENFRDVDVVAEVNRVFPLLEEAGTLLLLDKTVDIPRFPTKKKLGLQ